MPAWWPSCRRSCRTRARCCSAIRDDSVVGRYARAIALYRLPDLQQALAEIDWPDRGVSRTTRISTSSRARCCSRTATSRKRSGRISDSVRLAPGSPLLEIGLARSMIEAGGDQRNLRRDRPSRGRHAGRADQRVRLAPAGHRPGARGPRRSLQPVARRIRAAGRQDRGCASLRAARRGPHRSERSGLASAAGRAAGHRGKLIRSPASGRPAGSAA